MSRAATFQTNPRKSTKLFQHRLQRAIGLAVLGAFRFLATSRPVLVGVDDVQWLDRPSATVLGFALPLILTRLLPQAQFGTYKQIWLMVTTAYFMLQLGLAQSLYYFVPRKDGRARVWLTQASLSLVTLGGVCAVALYAARFAVARQFANPGLADFGLQDAFAPPQ